MRPRTEFKGKGQLLTTIARKIFSIFGIGITSAARLRELQEYASVGKSLHNLLDQRTNTDLEFLSALDLVHYQKTLEMFKKSKSQLRQDLFVLSELEYKRCGYFVEFGATNGINLSNSYLLEKDFGWQGILAEPAKIWHAELRANRPNSILETSCVWSDSSSLLTFNETADPELSTVDTFSDKDRHRESRVGGKTYMVPTISLTDLLRKYSAPRLIDYLSIDTEGSEYEILKTFDFEEFSFSVITVEHNYTPQRQSIFELLVSKGYERKQENISFWDDWYTRKKF